jgi:hypothetical protein
MLGKSSVNSCTFKLLACALMVVDHVGEIFFPGHTLLRLIGRLVFPTFAYLIAEGFRHTKDPTSYLGRLLLFSLISQPFYMFAFRFPEVHFNIFFTLSAGLYAIYAYNKQKSLWPVILAAASTEFVRASFGSPGVLMIFFMYRYLDNYKRMALAVFLLGILGFVRYNVWAYFTDAHFTFTVTYLTTHSVSALFQPMACLAVVLIALYNGKQGPKIKYFFYLFYPVHLAILGLIRCAVGK